MKNTTQFLEQMILFHTNINKKDTRWTVCKMQCLKNDLQLNVSEGSVSPIKPILMVVL